MTREEFYKLTDILNSDVLGNFMHGGEADELISMFEETIEKSGMLREDSVHRTKADVDAAMQDVEEKSKAFTDANKGESAEEILAQMKGEEPILEVIAKYLDHVSKEEAMKTKDAIDRWFAEYFPEPVSDELEKAADKYSQSIHSDYSNDMFDGHNIYDAVIYGAQWQKQQMMKGAVEGLVVCEELTHYYKDIVMPIPDYLKVGDKVKLIIIKEG